MSRDYRTVIFEGSESVGKTSLMKAFEVATGFRYPCIDRWLISAIVYSQCFRRHVDLIPDIYKELDELFWHHDILIVYLKVKLETQLERFKIKGDWLYKEADLAGINDSYEAVIKTLLKDHHDNILILRNNNGDQEYNVQRITNKIMLMIEGD